MNEFAGMTVNERLYVSNNMQKFEKACKRKDVNTVIRILKDIDVGNENIAAILKAHDFQF
ncbi:MAG: hypothetical protein LBV75_02955 [Paludibacter sp.]|jgi:hypothetical protein|nr:hypothetical protein [Paludibacter sp.]